MGPSEAELAAAARALAGGSVVAFPTETVWGLGCRPDRPGAVERLYELKGRPREKAFQLLVAAPEEVEAVAELPGPARRLVARFMPGPLTLVLRARPGGAAAAGPGGTVGVRVPDHPVALALLGRTGPLVATSANRSGEPTPATLEGVRGLFGEAVAVYLGGGPPPAGTPSTVVDATGPEVRVLREGAIPREVVEAAARGQGTVG